ncbi:glycoside hydrolase family 32 protein [Bacillus sp. FJAT-42376]|uniref:glycoside hydrolase family 32 protein n=1 Tax=Bacillus sp. FJAT-42376 TaxID=2014076 RepID=UPI000F506067|nr:glycoside hydrolase family 32 protein [Bacillus sp. FJAT-42376]AZB41833.1 glycoside hydrolase family 32 protein [Bacillus sp. FJAT-42376]
MLTKMKLQQAEDAVREAEKTMNERYRLGYHIMAPANWINDPNGFVQYKGEYHAFFQHHPYSVNWGPMHWGHVKSKDLVHWEHLPIALAPGDECDKDGCFSGSAVDNNGELTLIYTGHHYTDREKDLFYQNQNIAVSTDGIHFDKLGENPVIAAPPADSSHHFRDPKVWKHEDHWYMIVGNSDKNETGRVILYRSANLRNWDYIGVLAQSDGTLGFMWECPDFFELGGKHVLMFSPQGMKADGDHYNNLFQTGYLVGDYTYETNTYLHGGFKELDHGHDFYAVQTLKDDKGRRIAIGWMDMWESDMPTKKDGWCGALTLPREVTLGSRDQILMNPVEELERLRMEEHRVCSNETIQKSYTAEAAEDLMEIQAVINMAASSSKKAEIKILGSNGEHASVSYDAELGQLTLDVSKCGKKKDGIRRVSLKNTGLLTLRIYLDRSSIEVFANDGEATMTSRIYPESKRQGIEFTADADLSIKECTYWKLKDIWK